MPVSGRSNCTLYNFVTPEGSIVPTIDLFFAAEKKILTVVKSECKSFIKAFSNKGKAMEGYLNSNKVNFKSDADLAKLIGYYNSIK